MITKAYRAIPAIVVTALCLLLVPTPKALAQDDVTYHTGPAPADAPQAKSLEKSQALAAIFFTPSVVPTAGKVSPPFGPVVHVWTTEYDASGVHFSVGPPGPVPTAIFSDPPLAWGGVNPGGIVDLLASVDGQIVVPGTGGVAGQTSSLSIEGGFAGVGNLLLEVWDCNGNRIGATINDDGIGPTGRTLMTLNIPGMAAFRVSTPRRDTFGVDSIRMDEPTPCSVEVPVDVKPQSCRNPLNVGAKGVLPAAILGTSDLDVTQVDATTVLLAGVAPKRWDFEDVATPFVPFIGKRDCSDCTDEGPDGFLDLTLKFDRQAITEALEDALGPLSDGQCVLVPLAGNLLDGTPIVGEDVVVILKKGE